MKYFDFGKTSYDERCTLLVMAMAILRIQIPDWSRYKCDSNLMSDVMYFLYRSGYDVPYSFETTSFGPFCDEIIEDLEHMAMCGVVVSVLSKSPTIDFVPWVNADQWISIYRDKWKHLQEPLETVAGVVDRLIQDDSRALAHILNYIRWDELAKLGGAGEPDVDVIVNRIMKARSRCSREEIMVVYDLMKDAGIFKRW